ncbi:SAVED domain-containing protein [Mycolicibacterium sp. S3B2]|uniref:SAVED domain-containing protein n=1 Tax=Mycolicibacterium sp. S3B2 TaxID=3415120 RepID=UPI003C7C6CC6
MSYRRKRLVETDALVAALSDRGVPTWRDVDNLLNEPTEATIRSVLRDENTSGAILWLTPDVEDSAIIKNVEVPEAVGRYRRDDDFWLIVVLADGLEYSDVTDLFNDSLGIDDLAAWNLTKVSTPWASATDVSQVARAALRHRITRLAADGSAASIRVSVQAKGTMSTGPDDDLALDWTKYFLSGAPEHLAWEAMSAAARDVSAALKQLTPATTVLELSGTPSVPSAMLLGSKFSARDGRNPTWLQRQPNGDSVTPWRRTDSSSAALAKERGWVVSPPVYRSASAHALAVCVNVSDTVTEGFARSRASAPEWRAVLEIKSAAGRNTRSEPLSPDEAASLVHLIIDAIRETRAQVLGIDSIHFYIAGPTGLAFLLGTFLATLPIIATYEYDTASGLYAPAATFTT